MLLSMYIRNSKDVWIRFEIRNFIYVIILQNHQNIGCKPLPKEEKNWNFETWPFTHYQTRTGILKHCVGHSPGVYVRVIIYMNWIQNRMKGNSITNHFTCLQRLFLSNQKYWIYPADLMIVKTKLGWYWVMSLVWVCRL